MIPATPSRQQRNVDPCHSRHLAGGYKGIAPPAQAVDERAEDQVHLLGPVGADRAEVHENDAAVYAAMRRVCGGEDLVEDLLRRTVAARLLVRDPVVGV